MATVTELLPPQVEAFESVRAQPPMQNVVTGIDCGIDADCKITFKCGSKLFEVILSIDAPADSIEHRYLERLGESLRLRDEENTDLIFKELIDLLAGLRQPWFKRFADTTPANTPLRPTLHTLLYLKVLKLRLSTVNGAAEIHLHDASNGLYVSIPNSLRKEEVDVNIPTFKPSEIEILETLKRDTVFKALVQGSTMCAKAIGHQYSTQPAHREILSLQRISQAHLNPRLRTPTLLGLILSEDNQDLVIGFLMDYIEQGFFKSDLSFLNIDSIPQIQREV
ncbi:hypothetical protein MMC24_005180 [Lignoscripta atroalba]|nr:hypothetical protein [Lignoscripta atroalba]